MALTTVGASPLTLPRPSPIVPLLLQLLVMVMPLAAALVVPARFVVFAIVSLGGGAGGGRLRMATPPLVSDSEEG